MMPLSFIMKENFMERNMTATVFDANAHCSGYRKMCGTGFEHNLLKSIESDPVRQAKLVISCKVKVLAWNLKE
jgi:hypothetical protein